MTKLRQHNLKRGVESYLRELIFSGELQPGERVNQEQLADDLGVSRLPVREALIGLEKEGLIDNLPRRGAYVAALSPDDVRDHYHIFGRVSGLAAERAAARLDDQGIARLHELQTEMEEVAKLSNPDRKRLGTLNDEFHQIINRAGGSRRLRAVLATLAAGIPLGYYEFTTGWADVAPRHHREILNALEAGDGQAAGKAVASHLAESGEQAVMLLREQGFWDGGAEGESASSGSET